MHIHSTDTSNTGTVLFTQLDDSFTTTQLQRALFLACSSFGPVLKVSANRKALRGKAFVTFLHLPDAVDCASKLSDTPFLSASLKAQVI